MPTDPIMPGGLRSHRNHRQRLCSLALVLCLSLNGSPLTVSSASPPPPTLPPGFQASIWAQQDQLANPVAISQGPSGRLYIAEAHRKNTGVWGVTFSRWWAMEDYQGRTMADRVAMYQRWSHVIPEAQLREQTDRVRVLEDRDQDGRADQSEVYFQGLKHPLDGNAAGILALDNQVLLACIPHVWQLADSDRDLKAEISTQLLSGFGVRVGVHGHDLHGLIQGPDGRIYFTVGDRGYDVTSLEGERFHESHRGAVFRCQADGTQLEVFHSGLRNPQELAFNDYGDLFTVDNNMSGGDECRILHLLEGADSAWDATYQLSGHFRDETKRPDHPKPIWFTEMLWSRPVDGQPRWHNPAIGHLSRGPSGLAFYPGTGLSDDFRNTFFLADFVGGQANSGILSFKLAPSGASYTLAESERFAWNILATDLEFANEGGVFVSDWIQGWTGTGAGRVWKIQSKKPSALTKATSKLLSSPDTTRKAASDQLAQWLGHRDRRVRYRAQFELASRQRDGLETFTQTLSESQNELAQIQALWGLGQLARNRFDHSLLAGPVQQALQASRSEVRAQAAKVLAELDLPSNSYRALLPLLTEDSPRTTYQALISAAKRHLSTATAPVISGIQKGWLDDPALRHATVTYLASNLTPQALAEFQHHPSQAVREAAVLALRKLKSPVIEAFLADSESSIVFECIRAIHDLPIASLQENIASLLPTFVQRTTDEAPFPILHRLINSNFRLGKAEHARRVAATVANPSLPARTRLESILSLKQWIAPSDYDRVTWHLRPHAPTREQDIGHAIGTDLKQAMSQLLAAENPAEPESHSRLLSAVAEACIQYDLVDPTTAEPLALMPELPLAARSAFLKTLITRDTLSLKTALSLLSDQEPMLQAIAAVQLAQRDHEQAWSFLEQALSSHKIPLVQQTLKQLTHLKPSNRAPLLRAALQRASMQTLPSAAWLELFEQAEATPEVRAELERFKSNQLHDVDFGEAMLSLHGGDPLIGESLFKFHAAQCIRCHQVDGFGGSAGPDLSKIGSTLKRSELLESLLRPNQRIAPGFATTTLDLNNGEVVTGVIVEESDEAIRMRFPDRQVSSILKKEIALRSSQQSSMPPMGDILSLRELRDLVAYLAERK